jgi:YfiH family protein
MMALAKTSDALGETTTIRHGFFGRQGGVSSGEFDSLNVSVSTGDTADNVKKNRSIVAQSLGGAPLVTLKQVHSTRVVTIEAGALPDRAIEADALVTRRGDILIGVLTADCAPLLLVDPHAGIIGAAHAGWAGAVNGILENTVTAMEALGGQRRNILLAVGPTISGKNYEVGEEFKAKALAANPAAADAFFTPPGGKAHFDLPAFLVSDAQRIGLPAADNLSLCTYAQPDAFFSHRYATHKGTRTGRQISVIGMA